MLHSLHALTFLLAQAQQPAPPGEPPVSVIYKDGLQFKTDDFQATINGRLLAHYRTIFDRPDFPVERTSPDTLFLRQARIDVNVKLYREFDARFYFDFPTGTPNSVTGTLQDGYVGWSRWPEFTVRIGQFKEPFSQEQTTTLRATDFVERSVLDRLVPGRDLGISFAGKLGGGFLEYDLGAYNGNGRSVPDANDEKDVAARIRLAPLPGLRLGVAGTVGDVDTTSLAGATNTALDLTSTELAIKFLDTTAGVADGLRTRLGLELTWLYESFGLRAEYVRKTDTLSNGAALDEEELVSQAAYVSLTWLLTGEKKPLEARVVPLHPFNPSNGDWGAFELAVRAAGLEVDPDWIDGGLAAAAGNADRVDTFTAGINWYLTPHVRISPNFIVERYNESLTAHGEDTFFGGLVRFQVDF
jgi:phosphate-selective porin OprO/OprP